MRLFLFLCLFVGIAARAQTKCDTLEHDRPIMERIVEKQARQIENRGQQIALLKLRVSLGDTTASEIRKEANRRIAVANQQRDAAEVRANRAEADQPKTAIGRIWRKVELKVLAPVGEIALAGLALKLIFF